MSEFRPYPLNDDGRHKADVLAGAFDDLWSTIQSLVPNSRERALVFTKLQEAKMFAVLGMATQKENQT